MLQVESNNTVNQTPDYTSLPRISLAMLDVPYRPGPNGKPQKHTRPANDYQGFGVLIKVAKKGGGLRVGVAITLGVVGSVRGGGAGSARTPGRDVAQPPTRRVFPGANVAGLQVPKCCVVDETFLATTPRFVDFRHMDPRIDAFLTMAGDAAVQAALKSR